MNVKFDQEIDIPFIECHNKNFVYSIQLMVGTDQTQSHDISSYVTVRQTLLNSIVYTATNAFYTRSGHPLCLRDLFKHFKLTYRQIMYKVIVQGATLYNHGKILF